MGLCVLHAFTVQPTRFRRELLELMDWNGGGLQVRHERLEPKSCVESAIWMGSRFLPSNISGRGEFRDGMDDHLRVVAVPRIRVAATALPAVERPGRFELHRNIPDQLSVSGETVVIAEILGPDIFIAIAIVPVVYLLPVIVAAFRRAERWPTVALVNVILGWTILGWVVALCIAFASAQIRPALDGNPELT